MYSFHKTKSKVSPFYKNPFTTNHSKRRGCTEPMTPNSKVFPDYSDPHLGDQWGKKKRVKENEGRIEITDHLRDPSFMKIKQAKRGYHIKNTLTVEKNKRYL